MTERRVGTSLAPGQPQSVRHGVNDVVHADADSQVRKVEWVAWSVGPLPRIANVRIQGNGHHDAAFVVIDAHPARNPAVFLIAAVQVFGSWDAVSIVQIKDGVEDRVVIRNIHDRAFWKDHFHGLFEISLFLGSVEIVGHEKSAPEQVVTKLSRLGLGQAPLPYLNGIEPWPVVNFIAIIQADGLFHRPCIDPGQTPDRLGEGPIRTRIILGPQGKPLAPVTLKSGIVAIERARGVHQAGKDPLSRLAPVAGQRQRFTVFDGRVLAKGALCVENTEQGSGEDKRAARSPENLPGIHLKPPTIAPKKKTDATITATAPHQPTINAFS